MSRPKMAKIQGEGRRNGATPDDIPDGYITWEEHFMAWQAWAATRREPVPAQQIDREGGFTYRQVAGLLGHNPVTWEVREDRYSLFEFAPKDAPKDISKFVVEELPPQRSHIRDSVSENPICELEDDAPDGLFFFDVALGEHCDKCLTKMEVWLGLWIEMGKQETHA